MADTPAAAPGPPQQTPPQQEQPQQTPPHQPRRPPPPRPPAVRRPPGGPARDGQGPRNPDDPAIQRAALATRRSNVFVLLALGALVVGSLPLPWGIAGIGLGVAALVLGLMAVITAMDARLGAGRLAVLWVSLAVVAVVVLIQLVRLITYPSIVREQDCMREAITLTAQAACSQEAGLGG